LSISGAICFAGFRPAAHPVLDRAQRATASAANDVPFPLVAGNFAFIVESSIAWRRVPPVGAWKIRTGIGHSAAARIPMQRFGARFRRIGRWGPVDAGRLPFRNFRICRGDQY